MLDFGNLEQPNNFYDTTKEKVAGNHKIELPSSIDVEDICALKATAFRFKAHDETETISLRGSAKAEVRFVKVKTHVN